MSGAEPGQPEPPPALPDWAEHLRGCIGGIRRSQLSGLAPDPGSVPTRRAAVLMLFAAGADGRGEILLTERASGMRSHPGQVAFPGGSIDPDDTGPVDAALREAREETGLDPIGVEILGLLPDVYLPPSHFHVSPVVAWWRTPSPVSAVDPIEVARVSPVSLPALLDPANRFTTRLRHGYVGPAFDVDGFFVWGFTAGLLSRFLAVAGLEQPWDDRVVRPVPGWS